MHFCNFTAAAGAFAHHLAGRGEQVLAALDDLIGPHQLLQHGGDLGHKVLRGQLAALDLAQPVLPLSGQQRGLQLLRQDGNQGNGVVGRQKLHGFLALFAFQKAGGHQLFQNPGTGGGGAQPFTFGILRHIFGTSGLHRGKKRIFCEDLSR